MHYPRIVYHKDYKSEMDEKTRENHTRLAKSAEHHKELGSEWGEHPAVKQESKPEPKQEQKELVLEIKKTRKLKGE